MDELHRRVIRRIKEIATRSSIAITHLPDLAGVSRSHYWDVMAGRSSPSLVWLNKVAKALEVDLIELFRRDDLKRH